VFLGDGDLIIKDDVWIGARCHISPVGDAVITIEAHCDLGPEVMIITGGHEIDPNGCHIGGKGFNSSVSIGEGSWLGARATILPGVILPSKTLVAAGAVVVTSPEREMLLIAGVPASEKKDLHQLIK
jgi:acetyltransferase-like isoleucine patch superfamily enzyme